MELVILSEAVRGLALGEAKDPVRKGMLRSAQHDTGSPARLWL